MIAHGHNTAIGLPVWALGVILIVFGFVLFFSLAAFAQWDKRRNEEDDG